MTKKYRRNKNITHQEVDERVHILDEKEDAIITLNETATFLWKSLSKPMTADELADKIVAEYDINANKAHVDVQAFLSKVEKKGFVRKE